MILNDCWVGALELGEYRSYAVPWLLSSLIALWVLDKILLAWDLEPLTLVAERLRHLVVQLGDRAEAGHWRDGRLLLPLVAAGAARLIGL